MAIFFELPALRLLTTQDLLSWKQRLQEKRRLYEGDPIALSAIGLAEDEIDAEISRRQIAGS